MGLLVQMWYAPVMLFTTDISATSSTELGTHHGILLVMVSKASIDST